MNTNNAAIILASNSPRRKELLNQIGIVFTTDPADVDESIRIGEFPKDYVIRVALDKARTAAARSERGIVIAADTIVVLAGDVLGKPADSGDAMRMLAMLSNRKHEVLTGVTVLDAISGKSLSCTALTGVWFRDLSRDEITAYVTTGEPFDKAGAYGIQGKGALLVDKIEGCYFNVVGLPLSLLGAMLKDFGIKPLS